MGQATEGPPQKLHPQLLNSDSSGQHSRSSGLFQHGTRPAQKGTGQGHSDGCSRLIHGLLPNQSRGQGSRPPPPLASSPGAKLLPPHCGALRSTESPLSSPGRTGHMEAVLRAERQMNLGSPSPGHSSFVAERSQGFGVKDVGEASVFCPPGTRPLVPDTPNHRPHFSPRRLAFQPLQHQASKSQYESSCHVGREAQREYWAVWPRRSHSASLVSSSRNCGIRVMRILSGHPAFCIHSQQLANPRQSFQNPVAPPA